MVSKVYVYTSFRGGYQYPNFIFQHYPILNDRLTFNPKFLKIPYNVHSSNLPTYDTPQPIHYLCGTDIKNLQEMAKKINQSKTVVSSNS